jgi:hypothetical protein
VAEVPEEPPQARRAAGPAVLVGDDEDAVTDPRARRGRGERVGGRERVPPLSRGRQVGELVDPEERGARDVLTEVRLATRLDPREVVGAVDEPVDQ